MNNISKRLQALEKIATPQRRGALVILEPDGSMPPRPAWAEKCETLIVLPAKEGNGPDFEGGYF